MPVNKLLIADGLLFDFEILVCSEFLGDLFKE